MRQKSNQKRTYINQNKDVSGSGRIGKIGWSQEVILDQFRMTGKSLF